MYDWGFVSEQSANDLLLAYHHGVLDAPLALWYPVLPSMAGMHNLLVNLKFGQAASPLVLAGRIRGNSRSCTRLSIWGIRVGRPGRGLVRSPAGVRGSQSHADRVLDWMNSVSEPGHTRSRYARS